RLLNSRVMAPCARSNQPICVDAHVIDASEQEHILVSRRTFTATIALAGWLPALTLGQANKTPPWPADRLASLNKALGKLETSSQGRLGVALLDSASGQLASYRGDERFLMLSSFKTLAAAYILARSDRGED